MSWHQVSNPLTHSLTHCLFAHIVSQHDLEEDRGIDPVRGRIFGIVLIGAVANLFDAVWAKWQ